jgi:hypothetical protein
MAKLKIAHKQADGTLTDQLVRPTTNFTTLVVQVVSQSKYYNNWCKNSLLHIQHHSQGVQVHRLHY